ILRLYSMEDVLRLRGSVQIEHTLALLGAERLWHLLHSQAYVHALGALTGNQAVQMVQAGLNAIYASGWQVAADANNAGETYPDQSLYPADSCSALVRRINKALQRADVMGVPTLLIARTDANSAGLLLSDADPRDREFIKGPRTVEGFFEFRGGLEAAIARGLAYAPYVEMLWCETSQPDLDEARQFAEGIHAQFPGKMLAYNCSPSFNWKKKLSDAAIANFQKELGQMGYKFQFVTLAGFHTLNLSMFELASAYRDHGMSAYSQVQQAEFRMEEEAGYSAVKHQKFVGTGYFDEVAQTISAGQSSTTALAGSTEAEQFTEPLVAALPESRIQSEWE